MTEAQSPAMRFHQSINPKDHRKLILIPAFDALYSKNNPLARRDQYPGRTPKERNKEAAKVKNRNKRKRPNKEVDDGETSGGPKPEHSGAAPDMDSSTTMAPTGYASGRMEHSGFDLNIPKTTPTWVHRTQAQVSFGETEPGPPIGQVITNVTKQHDDVNSSPWLNIQENPECKYTQISPRMMQELHLEPIGMAPVGLGYQFPSYTFVYFHLTNGKVLHHAVLIQLLPTERVDFWIGYDLKNQILAALNEGMPTSPPDPASFESDPLTGQLSYNPIASYADLGRNHAPTSQATADTHLLPYTSNPQEFTPYPQNMVPYPQDTTHYEQAMTREGLAMGRASFQPTAQAMAPLESHYEHMPDHYAQPPRASLGTGMGSPASFGPMGFHPSTNLYDGLHQPPLNSTWSPAMAQHSLNTTRRS